MITKLVELRFAEFVLLDALLDNKFCFKCWKETLWLHLEHLQYEIFNTCYCFFKYFFKFFSWLKFGVYTFILKKLSLNLVILFTDKILSLNFFLFRMNKFLHFSIGLYMYTTDKSQPCVVNRCSITARTSVKYLFHNELKNIN